MLGFPQGAVHRRHRTPGVWQHRAGHHRTRPGLPVGAV